MEMFLTVSGLLTIFYAVYSQQNCRFFFSFFFCEGTLSTKSLPVQYLSSPLSCLLSGLVFKCGLKKKLPELQRRNYRGSEPMICLQV